MIDPIVQRFLEQTIDSPVKLHLLLIFHENSRLEVTALTIAEKVCRDIWSVAQALHELSEDGVMSRSVNSAGETSFRYAPQPSHVEAIRRLIAGYNDPIERDLIQRSIREIAAYAPFRRASAWEFQVA